jgi:hypothetical protein
MSERTAILAANQQSRARFAIHGFIDQMESEEMVDVEEASAIGAGN